MLRARGTGRTARSLGQKPGTARMRNENTVRDCMKYCALLKRIFL
jgi:hypothetical protein